MKMNFLNRAALLLLLFGLSGAISSAAQPSTASSPSKETQVPPPILDNDEMAQLQKVRAQVLSAHPDLKSEEEKLTLMHNSTQNQSPAPTSDQRNAMFAEWKAYQKKMRAEMLKIDPTLSPLFAKLDNARKHGAPSPFQPAAVNKKSD